MTPFAWLTSVVCVLHVLTVPDVSSALPALLAKRPGGHGRLHQRTRALTRLMINP